MALSKVTYTDDVTVIEAQNMNDIQDEILRIDPSYATGKKINNNDDLNNYTTPGFYYCESGTTALTLTNAPSGLSSAFSLTVTIKGGIYRIQLLTAGYQTYTRVSGSNGWSGWYTFAYLDGGTFTGHVTIDRTDGTTSAQGYSSLLLGNNKASGTAGNSKGQVIMYGISQYSVNLHPNNLTADRQIAFPDTSGTLALTSDITFSYKGTLSGSSVDLNTYYTAEKRGVYLVTTGVTNAPTTYGCLLAMGDGGFCVQMFVKGSIIYSRQRSGDPVAWGTWKSVTLT